MFCEMADNLSKERWVKDCVQSDHTHFGWWDDMDVMDIILPHSSTHSQDAGPRLNIKTVLSTYGDFHVKDKTAVRTSYL